MRDSLHEAESMLQRGCCCGFCSYRGYGLSQGTPTEAGLQLDAQASLDYLHNDPAVIKDNVSPACLAPVCVAAHTLYCTPYTTSGCHPFMKPFSTGIAWLRSSQSASKE